MEAAVCCKRLSRGAKVDWAAKGHVVVVVKWHDGRRLGSCPPRYWNSGSRGYGFVTPFPGFWVLRKGF